MAGASHPGEASQVRIDALAASLAKRWNALLDIIDRQEPDLLVGWRDLAACRGTYDEVFFPEQGRPRVNAKAAIKWCEACPVKIECRDYAIRNDVREGIWGGMSYHQRKKKP